VADSVRVQLVVHNASTQHTIQVLWLSFEGNEVTAQPRVFLCISVNGAGCLQHKT